MADEVPIIIGSDDEDSDSDDVVLVKEEIEVEEDNDDVIFMSETKPPKSTDQGSKDRLAPKLVRSQSVPPQDLDQPRKLHRSISITTGTRQISLDDNQNTGSSFEKIPQYSNTTSFSGPLDLSSKSCDTLLPASGTAYSSSNTGSDMQTDIAVSPSRLTVLNPWHSSDATDLTSGGSFASASPFTNASTVIQCSNSAIQPCTIGGNSDNSAVSGSVPMDISSYTDLTVLPGGFFTNTAMLPQLMNQANPTGSVYDQGCSTAVTSIACSGNSNIFVSSFYPNNLFSSTSNKCDKTSVGATGCCSSSLTDSINAKSPISSTVSMGDSVRSSDPSLPGQVAFLCTDTTLITTSGASPVVSCPQSTDATNHSSASSDAGCKNTTANLAVDDLQAPIAPLSSGLQAPTQSTSLSSSDVSSSADLPIPSSSPDVPGASGLDSSPASISSTTNPVATSLCSPLSSVSDSFATSQRLVSSLVSSNSPTLTPSSYGDAKSPPKVMFSTSSACSIQSATVDQSTVTQSSCSISGLPGGSISFITNQANCDASGSSAATATDWLSKCIGSNSSNNSFTQQFNGTYAQKLYNPLTLPVSMQNQHLKQSMSLPALTNRPRTSAKLAKRFSSFPRSPPSCASYSLPPKKQKRCYGEGNSTCANCEVTLVGEKFSRCPNGHTACAKCLEEKVKLLLTGKAKESVRCLNRSCDSFYPVSELRLSLPSIVVEILEDKLDQEYVDYISDMMLRNASGDSDQTSSSSNAEQESTSECKKDERYPDHWSPMDERVVQSKGYCLVKLEEDTAEYEEVVLQFFQSMIDQNVEVTSVHRVQNPIQWKYYCVKKSEILQDNDRVANEKQLFHGTSCTVVDAICRRGFDWRVCGKHGTLFGQGSYFAVHASYSHQYTDLKQLRPLGSSMMMANPMSMTLPTTPSLFYPPVNVNFGQPLGSLSFTALNLSHNASGSGLSGSAFQPTSASSTQTPSSSQSVQTMTPQVQVIQSSQRSHASLSPPTVSVGHRFLSTRFKVVTPQAANIRTVTGHPSYGLVSSPEGPKKKTAKVFLARVLVGKYVKGNSKLRKPPPLNPQLDPFGKCFDSCVDEMRNPKIFVIFDSAQAYPEYLLEYTYSSE